VSRFKKLEPYTTLPMNLFDVYPLLDVEPVKANGCWLRDKNGNKYLDLYGGHAVISIGHSHPYYKKKIEEQLEKIGFYSNSVKIPVQQELACKLGDLSGYPGYNLFLCNSGAEANENALKLASFYNGRKKIIAFSRAFHGRTSLAVAATDNTGTLASFSNYGSTVDIAAPGVSIASTYKGSSYALLSGTSMASPHVAGIAALVQAKDPAASNATVRSRLEGSATTTVSTPDGSPLKLVDAYAAVTSTLP